MKRDCYKVKSPILVTTVTSSYRTVFILLSLKVQADPAFLHTEEPPSALCSLSKALQHFTPYLPPGLQPIFVYFKFPSFVALSQTSSWVPCQAEPHPLNSLCSTCLAVLTYLKPLAVSTESFRIDLGK